MKFRQTLYWSNLPYKRVRHKRSSRIFRKTFLKDAEYPLIVFTGTNKIDLSRFYFSTQFCQKIKKKPLEFFLYEPVSYYIKDEGFNLGFYSEFHNKDNNNPDLRAEELDSINEFGKFLGKKITVNLCDWNIPKHFSQLYTWLNLQTRDIFIREAANSSEKKKYSSKKINTKFWCANGRYTIHRHIVMCYLAHFSGNFSWFFESSCDWQQHVNWLEDLPFSYLEEGNNILKKRNLVIDKRTNIIEVDHLAGYYKPNLDFTNLNTDYKDSYEDSFCCIINETRFAQPSANFSEKTLHAISMERPFILVAPPKTLEYLQKFGFKTFSAWWDESYDQEINHSRRMSKIFSLFNKINTKSLSEIREIYDQMKPTLKHNQALLDTLKNDERIFNAFTN